MCAEGSVEGRQGERYGFQGIGRHDEGIGPSPFSLLEGPRTRQGFMQWIGLLQWSAAVVKVGRALEALVGGVLKE